MNQPRTGRSRARRPPQRRPARPVDPWRAAPALPDFEPITMPDDVGALVRSLGDPPTAGGDVLASYFTAAVERAAALAAALALSAELPAAPPDTTDAWAEDEVLPTADDEGGGPPTPADGDPDAAGTTRRRR